MSVLFLLLGPNPDPCLDPRSYTIGRTAIGFPTSAVALGSFVQYTLDTNCTDGRCDSGLLISRLQVPNRCWEPLASTPDQIFGLPLGAQNAYNVTFPDGTVALRSFPMGGMKITWEFPGGGVRQYRYAALQAESLMTFYVLATDNYQVYSQYDVASTSPLAFKSYNATVDYSTVVSGRFVKQPTAHCGVGSCEAQPITSTLHIDTQGFCDQIDSITIRQRVYNGAGTDFAVVDHRPNCSSLYNQVCLIDFSGFFFFFFFLIFYFLTSFSERIALLCLEFGPHSGSDQVQDYWNIWIDRPRDFAQH